MTKTIPYRGAITLHEVAKTLRSTNQPVFAELVEQGGDHLSALAAAAERICANPAVQDLIEANPQTNYLIRDLRAVLAKAAK